MLNPGRPFFFLLLYIVVLYIRPQEYVPALMGTPLVPVSLLTAFGFWLVAQPKNFEASQHRLLLGLLAMMSFSVLLTGWVTGAIDVVTDFIPTLMLFYVTATSLDSLKRFRDFSIVLTALSTVIAIHGSDQFASELGIGWTGAKMIESRITYLGFLGDPNDLSMAFLMTLPLTLYVAKVSGSFIVRIACYASTGTVLYAIYLCNSRGSMLGLLAMVAFYAIQRFGWVRSVIVGPALLIPLLLLAPSRVSEISADEDSAAGRIDAWYEGFDMFRTHPLFGVGKGLFTEHHPLTAHNSFVLAIAELGTVGYFFWLSILIVSGLMLARILRSAAPDELPPPVIDPGTYGLPPVLPVVNADTTMSWADLQLAARALAYSMIGSLVTAFFLSRSYVVFLFLLVAMIVAVYQMARTRWPGFAPVRATDMIGSLILLDIGSIVFLWLVTRVLLGFS
ncbi:MAG: O-antigen ligase family protein [Burkholderiales bacterium]|nr:O-antigen ligase family protein [Burkholderiales bacterium]